MKFRKYKIFIILTLLSISSCSSNQKQEIAKKRSPKENAALAAGPVTTKKAPQQNIKEQPIASKDKLNSAVNNKAISCTDVEINNEILALRNSPEDLKKAEDAPWIALSDAKLRS